MAHKGNKYNLDRKTADATLQNVFAACEVEPNETPLEVIKIVSFANAAIVRVCFRITIALLVVILLLPLAF